MIANIPFNIGDKITIDGKSYEIKALHCFIDKNGYVSNVRAFVGGNERFITLVRKKEKGKWQKG